MKPELEPAHGGPRGFLFVCSGNMVRSAFAHVFALHLGCPVPVRSAATTYRNERMLAETARALRARGVARAAIETFRPQHLDDLSPDCARSGATVLVMTEEHLRALVERGWSPDRVRLLDSVLNPSQPRAIRDPVLEGADFEATFQHIARAVERLVAGTAPRPA